MFVERGRTGPIPGEIDIDRHVKGRRTACEVSSMRVIGGIERRNEGDDFVAKPKTIDNWSRDEM